MELIFECVLDGFIKLKIIDAIHRIIVRLIVMKWLMRTAVAKVSNKF